MSYVEAGMLLVVEPGICMLFCKHDASGNTTTLIAAMCLSITAALLDFVRIPDALLAVPICE